MVHLSAPKLTPQTEHDGICELLRRITPSSWSIRADAVRRLDRGEPEPETIASRSSVSAEGSETSGEPSYGRSSTHRVPAKAGAFFCAGHTSDQILLRLPNSIYQEVYR